MDNLLVKIILISTILQLGLKLEDFANCSNHQCIQKIDQASQKVLKIDWKPISLFPEEAKKFR